MLNPEIKVDNNCKDKLQKIDQEISKAKKTLEDFKNSKDPSYFSHIEALKLELKELQRKKLEIINETQSCLAGERVEKEDLKKVSANLDNTNLSWEEKAKVQEVLNSSWDLFDTIKIENGWIIWIILAILQALLRWTWSSWEYWEYEEADTTETPWRIIKWKEKTPKDKENFIAKYKDIAKQIENEFKIPWQVVISQAGLESAWGTSALAVNYNNLFGIKAKKWWKSILLWTNEEINGKMIRKKEPFRIYDSIEESFRDYANFLIKNPRYANAFNYSNDPIKFAIEIAKAWYATDSNYASKLTSTMKWVA